jgi:hypothetical protein
LLIDPTGKQADYWKTLTSSFQRPFKRIRELLSTWFTSETVLSCVENPCIRMCRILNKLRDLIPQSNPCFQIPAIQFDLNASLDEFLRDEVDVTGSVVFSGICQPCSRLDGQSMFSAHVQPFSSNAFRHSSDASSSWPSSREALVRRISPSTSQRTSAPSGWSQSAQTATLAPFVSFQNSKMRSGAPRHSGGLNGMRSGLFSSVILLPWLARCAGMRDGSVKSIRRVQARVTVAALESLLTV